MSAGIWKMQSCVQYLEVEYLVVFIFVHVLLNWFGSSSNLKFKISKFKLYELAVQDKKKKSPSGGAVYSILRYCLLRARGGRGGGGGGGGTISYNIDCLLIYAPVIPLITILSSILFQIQNRNHALIPVEQ